MLYRIYFIKFLADLPGEKETPFGANVLDKSTFLFPKIRNNVQMCELPKDHPCFEKIEDDNFVCSMRTTVHPETNSKALIFYNF